MSNRLISLYAEIYELSRELCSKCHLPFNCCEIAGCDQATVWAKSYGITLEAVSFETRLARGLRPLLPPRPPLPYLANDGCVVAPHHRMVCSLFLCREALELAPKRFFELRAEIVKLEGKRWELKSGNG